MSISVDGTGRISGLLMKPGAPLPTVRTLDDLDRALDDLGINASVATFTVGGDHRCSAGHTSGDQGAHPLGSMFKLYVLGAVEKAVADGRLSWDGRLTVTDAVKSLPSGQLQDAPTGTTVTVERAAELMISISDNTAADMLIDAVGRARVEQSVVRMGAAQPSLLTPFLRTRELFTLDGDIELRARWSAIAPSSVDPNTGTAQPPNVAQVAARAALPANSPPHFPRSPRWVANRAGSTAWSGSPRPPTSAARR